MEAVLTVESVRLYFLKMGMRLDDLTDSEQEMIDLAIRDVRREDMSPEEIEFAESYFLNVENTVYTNYELREAHRTGYTINTKTGRLNAPGGQEAEFHHSFLPEELRTRVLDFQKRVDMTNDPELMELVRLRQAQREKVAKMRSDLLKRKESGEEIGKKEMAEFHRKANEIGLYSEKIAEKSLTKYLDGEGFILVYPEIGAPSPKSGDFDRIYIKEENGRYQVFELKGGSSPIGTRKITNVPGVESGKIGEQGTRPYLLQILFEMGKREKTEILALEIREALDKGMLDYLYYRQDFTQSGDLKQPEMGQFDIRK
jgi:hypothetical protein